MVPGPRSGLRRPEKEIERIRSESKHERALNGDSDVDADADAEGEPDPPAPDANADKTPAGDDDDDDDDDDDEPVVALRVNRLPRLPTRARESIL